MKTTRTQAGTIVQAKTTPKEGVKITSTQLRTGLNSTFVTVLAIAVLAIFLAPFAFMIFTSLKTQDQISIVGAPIWPAQPPSYEYNGKQVDVFSVPLAKCQGFDPGSGASRNLAIVKKGQKESVFVDPNDLGRG